MSPIYIEPPESNICSDEDSADEDSGGLRQPQYSRPLRAGAEIVLTDGRRTGRCDSDEDEEECEKQSEESPNVSSCVVEKSADSN